MNKTELVDALAARHFGDDKRLARHALDAVLDQITRGLVRSDRVILAGFGTFAKVVRPGRAILSQTEAIRLTEAVTAPVFHPSTALKAYVAEVRTLEDAPPTVVAGSLDPRTAGGRRSVPKVDPESRPTSAEESRPIQDDERPLGRGPDAAAVLDAAAAVAGWLARNLGRR